MAMGLVRRSFMPARSTSCRWAGCVGRDGDHRRGPVAARRPRKPHGQLGASHRFAQVHDQQQAEVRSVAGASPPPGPSAWTGFQPSFAARSSISMRLVATSSMERAVP